ncbi:hypothetical protein [Chryseobacterium indoltheticum]|uniref:hypothetical protein n=1 Tax=Chryseobacterium indoltheticum TaxID=254 RepID=UPI003F496498
MENNLDVRIASGAEYHFCRSLFKTGESSLRTLRYQFSLKLHFCRTQPINTQFGQIIGERRYVNQFDITATIGWEADLWGKMKSQQKAQLATYLEL